MRLFGFPFCKLALASAGNHYVAFAIILAASGKHILLLAIVLNPASIYAHEQMEKCWHIIYWHHEILAIWTKHAAWDGEGFGSTPDYLGLIANVKYKNPELLAVEFSSPWI